MATTPDVPTLTLNDGQAMPAVGFGTSRLRGAAGVDVIAAAIAAGYRMIDTAANYDNEGGVGEAIRRAGVPRGDLFVTSKLPGRRHPVADAIGCVEESLYRARLDHFDLYLVHWPNPQQGLYVEAWQAMIAVRQRGLVRSIGVSNFLPEHLERLIAETGVAPAVNQVELHPYFPQAAQRAANAAKGIVTQSWSPLGRGSEVLRDPAVVAIAERLGRSAGQVILRWHVQLGAVPLPRSSDPGRQAANLALFDFALTDADMAAIAALARPDGRLLDQDPARYEEF